MKYKLRLLEGMSKSFQKAFIKNVAMILILFLIALFAIIFS